MPSFAYELVVPTHPAAECSPKWKLATDVLAEIRQDHTKKKAPPGDPLALSTANRVLFLVKDSLALAQLRDVLVSGTANVCDQRYRWFISQQAAEIRSRAYKQHAQQQSRRQGGAKRPVPGQSDSGAAKHPRVDAVSSAGSAANSDSRNAFLYPSDSDLLGVPTEPAPGAAQGND